MSVVFSDTTNKNGLIEICERLTTLGDGQISGDTVTLQQFTAAINDAYNEVLPLVFASDNRFQWDDVNHTFLPISTTDLVSGQRDYSFISDSDGATILKINKVAIRVDATTADYSLISQTDQNDVDAHRMIEDNPSNTGIPFRYDLKGNTFMFDVTPDYSSTDGIKIWFERTPDYFVSTDTTQTPGIPDMFHSLLALIASHEFVFTYMPDEGTIITRLEQKIASRKIELSQYMSKRSDVALMARAIYKTPE